MGMASSIFSGSVLSFLLVFFSYVLMAKDAPKEVYVPRPKNVSDYVRLLKDRDTWWFNLFYAVSFGAFVGFAMYMKVYLMAMYFDEMEVFGIEILGEENIHVVAGYFAAFCIMAGALLRPVGGAIADKIGGDKITLYFPFECGDTYLSKCIYHFVILVCDHCHVSHHGKPWYGKRCNISTCTTEVF